MRRFVGDLAGVLGFAVLAGIAWATIGASATGPGRADLERRLSAVEDRLAQLEARIAQIERTPPPAVPTVGPASSGAAPSGPGDWRYKGNWDQLRVGMSREQIVRLLGEPTRRYRHTLYYEGFVQAAGCTVTGNVEVDSDGRLAVINAPAF